MSSLTSLTSLAHPDARVRGVLRSTGVLGLSLALTVGVLLLLSSVVDGWA